MRATFKAIILGAACPSLNVVFAPQRDAVDISGPTASTPQDKPRFRVPVATVVINWYLLGHSVLFL
jgi:hypothetical protein